MLVIKLVTKHLDYFFLFSFFLQDLSSPSPLGLLGITQRPGEPPLFLWYREATIYITAWMI